MQIMLPQMKRCCFCFSLRNGIIIFGILNMLFSVAAVAYVIITTDLHRAMITNDVSLEVGTVTLLFVIFGMSVLLSILLLFASYQKDIILHSLYNYYAPGVIICGLIPNCILLARLQLTAAILTSLALVVQCYIVFVVRSEIMKLREKQDKAEDEFPVSEDEQEAVDISDRETLV
ncbi:hypothetical protein K1T71_002380 [Dendrolimus kikuchii]|uniref:Uncharacterized protein n=1 Tax=Dendrolimus kikuchii TaxID=765133 RepID=A0ACC1DCI5_9NEOP|nr:hypothetical protein K1T71_002380 [Dendrolimus kikuchii]